MYYDDAHTSYTLYMRGIIGFITNVFWFLTIILLPLGDSIAIILMSPIIATMLALIIYNLDFKRKQIICCLGGILGALFIGYPTILTELIFGYSSEYE